MFISFVYDPNGVVATALSLFPLTSPVGMMSRLAATNDVPVWQIILSACILLITTLVVIYLVSNAFRAKNLFVGQKFNFKRLLLVLIGKA
jgi:ABC-2 type transport system permease protein